MATIELEDAFADDSLEMDEVGDKFRVAADLQARIVATGPITSAPPSQITVTPAATGAATETARADHVHDVAVATPTALSVGGSNAEGSSTALARADHRHALPAFGSPVAEAIGSAAADGVATTLARSDHVHAMPAAGTPVALTSGGTNAAGSAATLARSDHVHGLPAFPLLASTAPADVQVQTAAAGVATDAARRDHAHNVLTAAPTALAIGSAQVAGSAATLARSDHVHAMPAAGAPAALPIGALVNAGSAGTFARSDHVHAMPGFGTVANSICEGNDPRLLTAADPGINGFRLAPTADDSIPADGTFNTIYLAPVEGDRIALWDGSAWVSRQSNGASYVLAGRTADLPFDVFANWNGSAILLDIVNWASATARATPISRWSGVWTRTDNITRRYLGTVRPRSATTYKVARRGGIDTGSCGIDYWNQSNRRQAGLRLDGSGYAYSTAAYRQANGSVNAQVDVVSGLGGDLVAVWLASIVTSTSGAIVGACVAIGRNSTTVPESVRTQAAVSSGTNTVTAVAQTAVTSAQGIETFTWMEMGNAGVTFHGNPAVQMQSGLTATIWY